MDKLVAKDLGDLHPKAIKIVEDLGLTEEEQERFWWVLEDISSYYQGSERELKRIYRGVGGSLFWSWDVAGRSPEENV